MTGPAPQRPPRVLVADDDGTTRTLIRHHLETSGHEVLEAKNGAEALRLAREGAPDVVLMDVVMPVMDGFAACRAIRCLPENGQVPILMITGLDDGASIEAAYEAGATDFSSKPIQWASLRHRIRYMVRQKLTADRLRDSEARLANAQRIARMGHWEWEVDGGRLRWSDELYTILGVRPYRFDGTLDGLLELVHREERDQVERAFKAAAVEGVPLSVTYRITHPEQGRKVIHQEAEMVTRPGQPRRMVGTLQDVSEQCRAEERIAHLALYDPLTDLPNRKLFKDLLARALKVATTHPAAPTAVMFVGLDRFKRINDTLGHEVGDTILKQTAQRLRDSLDTWAEWLRPRPEVVISRFGGDEFTVILERMTQPDDAARAARQILDSMARPFHAGGEEIYITTSIGIALYPGDGDSVSALLRNADAALRHAKGQGKNTFQFYAQSMNGNAMHRLSLESKLQKAVENGELELHYQPKVDVRRGNVTGMEALVRWRHPELGMISPANFVPIAEESGLIGPIGEWVLREACFQNKRWQNAGLTPMMVSVNVSAHQFWQRDLPERVACTLVEANLDPRYLELEITEGTFMHDAEETVRMLTDLKHIGLRLSVDDFGTGYSSLAYLQRFPIDTLKVDRSFVTGVTTNPDSAAITRTIINMAHSLGLGVIAEGVETPEQFAFLAEQGCNQIQGYLFSAPLTAERFGTLIAERRRLDVKGMLAGARAADPLALGE
ncbi:MAG: EAL domain-containing protein [Nitrospirae bacterium]|nr:EAL domain-containing protein [Nitrospirota bacterium]